MKFCGKTIFTPIFSLITLFAFVGCGDGQKENPIEFKINQNYPRWVKSSEQQTDQTSGIAFINSSKNVKTFLLCDDIGDLHRLEIKDDTVFTLHKIKFGKNAEDYLSLFPKKDFEEITYDKTEGIVYLSIEGNNPDPKKFTKIVKVIFFNNDIMSDSVVSFEQINFYPADLFHKHLDNNISYEGLAVDEKYFYLSLEGFSEGGIFADSTVLFIADKNSKKIVKEINTRPLGIHTICGLYSETEGILWGVDRNNKKIFRLIFDDELEVESFTGFDFETTIPGYRNLKYVGALESITMDEKKQLYLIDDPWKKFYVPSGEILEKLDEQTINNFKKFIPTIYLFNINP